MYPPVQKIYQQSNVRVPLQISFPATTKAYGSTISTGRSSIKFTSRRRQRFATRRANLADISMHIANGHRAELTWQSGQSGRDAVAGRLRPPRGGSISSHVRRDRSGGPGGRTAKSALIMIGALYLTIISEDDTTARRMGRNRACSTESAIYRLRHMRKT